MADPTDQPVQQADPEHTEPAVRADLGGWISGPCLDPATLELPANWLPDPSQDWPADGRQRPAQ